MKISEIKIGERHRNDLGDIDALVKSINEVGLIHPLAVNEDKKLIAGYRRIEACKKLGWKETPVNVVPLDNIARGEFDENTLRKDFTAGEKVAIIDALVPKEQEAAEERMKSGRPSGKFPKGRAKGIAAKKVGWSYKTYEKAKAVVKAAKKEPNAFKDLEERLDKNVHSAFNELKRRQYIKERQKKAENVPKASKGGAWIMPDITKPDERVEVDADYVPEVTTFPSELDGKYFAFAFFGDSKAYKTIKRNIDAITSSALIDQIGPTKTPLVIRTDSNLKILGDRRLNKIAGKKDRPASGFYREGWTYWGGEIPGCKWFIPAHSGIPAHGGTEEEWKWYVENREKLKQTDPDVLRKTHSTKKRGDGRSG